MRENPEGVAVERRYRRAVVLLTLTGLLLSAFWAIALPYFDGPDESRHYNSVARIVDGGGWPLPYAADIFGSTQVAIMEAGGTLSDGQTYSSIPAASERSALLTGVPDTLDEIDNMVQHPPGYYAVDAILVKLFGGAELRWDQAHIIMRGGSALMLALAIPFVVGVGRRLSGSPGGGLIAGIGMLMIPFYTVMGGYVSNDTLLVTLCSATVYFLVRAGGDPRSSAWWLPAAGIAYGAALMTKGLALMLAPAVIILAIMAVVRRGFSVRAVLSQLLVPAILAGAVGGWWWIRNYLLLGVVQPSQLGGRASSETPSDAYDLPRFFTQAISRMNATFWGRGGSDAKAFPDIIELLLGILLILVLVGAFVVSRRRVMLAVLLSYPMLILVTLFANSHSIFWDTGAINRGMQGRYLFSGAFAFGAAFALVAVAWRGRIRRPRALAAASAWGPAIATTLAATWLVPRSWSPAVRAADGLIPDNAMGISLSVYIVLALALLIVTAALCATMWRLPAERAEAGTLAAAE